MIGKGDFMKENSARKCLAKNAKWILIVLLIILAASAATRAVQYFTAIDFNTGFYKEGHFSVVLLTVLLWIGGIGAFLLAFCRSNDNPGKSSVAVITGSIIAGALLIIQSAGGFTVTAFAEISGYGVLGTNTVNAFDYIIYVLQLISGIVFLIYAAKRKSGKKAGLYMIFPALYTCCHLIKAFMLYTTIINISENLFDILNLCANLLFLYAFTRYAMGMTDRKTRAWLAVTSYWAALFGFITAVPRITVIAASYFVPMTGIIEKIEYPQLAQFGISIFALIMCVMRVFAKKKRFTAEAETETPENETVQ